MRIVLFTYIGIILLLLGSSPASHAQRTSQGKPFIGLNQFVSACAIPSGGIGVEGGQYLLHSYWKAGIRAVDWNQKAAAVTDGDGNPIWFDHVLWNLHGSWMYRLAASYGRRISLYVGAGAFLGINRYEVLRSLPPELRGGFPQAEFVYGMEPAADLEVFPWRRVALVLGVQSPVTLGSSLKADLWHLSGSLGVRINL